MAGFTVRTVDRAALAALGAGFVVFWIVDCVKP